MTDVTAAMLRPRSFEMFADLTPAPVVGFSGDGETTTVTFDGALTASQVEQVRARMASRDDADQRGRARLADLRAAAAAPTATTDDVKALALAVSAYLLGIEAQ